ncbi:MAG: ferrochelatase [Gammaproteobacteria bacterium]|nr:ferrochelatase [Gammaproteobacteria bacterium]MDA7962310.1 ferrochelatase [Gammaproteobacteria bacterium]MDA7972753.1 ferrochelatase [Gammaproteobacteria bacterium]CAJ2376214.1 MAG: Ferrochelatase [Arenicellales bacterium IbO2]
MPALTAETETRERIGVLLTNLGTPDSCAPGDVRRYLREFLSDRRVVGLPRILWLPLLHGVVLNTRPRKSANAYAKIWRDDGSPLLVFSRMQQRKLQRRFDESAVVVELGMRYGNPSIAAALEKLHAAGARKVLVLPLYPQYCSATTASTFDALGAAFARRWHLPALRFVDHYHDHPKYIAALARSVRAHNSDGVLVMSFHGIPEAFADAGDPYPAQCKTTARLLADELKLADDEWRLSFQSRFGPARWLQPGTEETLAALAQDGVQSVRVICPGFSADCLETLEEIAIGGRETFLQAGGRHFQYIPCMNDEDAHIDALQEIIRANLGDWLAPA